MWAPRIHNACKLCFWKKARRRSRFDGDGDRVIAVDDSAICVDGDKLCTFVVKYLASKKRLKQNVVVATVMSNLGFYKALEKAGLTVVRLK